jgi:hypothetical protein
VAKKARSKDQAAAAWEGRADSIENSRQKWTSELGELWKQRVDSLRPRFSISTFNPYSDFAVFGLADSESEAKFEIRCYPWESPPRPLNNIVEDFMTMVVAWRTKPDFEALNSWEDKTFVVALAPRHLNEVEYQWGLMKAAFGNDADLAYPDDSSGSKQQEKTKRIVGETPTSSQLEDSSQHEIASDKILEMLGKLGVSDRLRQQVAAEIVLANKQKRPQWDDRKNHKNLAHLSAPRFLKTVYADFIGEDGKLTNEEAIRLSDPVLVRMVQAYINKRQERSLPLGDAEGLAFRNIDGRGRPKKTPRKQRRLRGPNV